MSGASPRSVQASQGRSREFPDGAEAEDTTVGLPFPTMFFNGRACSTVLQSGARSRIWYGIWAPDSRLSLASQGLPARRAETVPRRPVSQLHPCSGCPEFHDVLHVRGARACAFFVPQKQRQSMGEPPLNPKLP